MSYDLYVHRPDIPEDCLHDLYHIDDYVSNDYTRVRYFNYTYNLSKFFTDFHVNPRRDLDGKTASQVADMIDKALADINQNHRRVLHKLYDSPGGYGTVEGATAWLRSIRDFCRAHPDYRVIERS